MIAFPKLTEQELLDRIRIPSEGKLNIFLDTDTYNEIDDQFAILYAMLSPERLCLKGISAALFFNDRSASPADGMEKSYREILKIMDFLGKDPEGFVFRGCTEPLADEEVPRESLACDAIIAAAMKASETDPLYVVGIGACTNIASAILKAPEIIRRITVVWLGGNTFDWPDNKEFNLSQDSLAGKVLFDCGVPMIQIPAFGVTGFLLTSVPELEACLSGANPACDYLVENVKSYSQDHFAWSKPIWDVGAIGYLINPDWAESKACPAPIIAQKDRYAFDPRRHLIRSLITIDRDKVFKDMFQKLRDCRK